MYGLKSIHQLHRDNALAATILAEHGIPREEHFRPAPSKGARDAIKRAQDGIARLTAGQCGRFPIDPNAPDSAPAGRVIVNIGLARNDGGPDNSQYVTVMLLADLGGGQVQCYNVRQSATERTLVAQLARPLSDKATHELCAALAQDCIAQRIGEHGRLIGPHAAKWGEFNPEYFLDLDSAPAASEPAASAPDHNPLDTLDGRPAFAPVNGKSTAEQRKRSNVDTVGHSSIQAWSAGDLFPAVIARREHYSDNGSLRYAVWELEFPGCELLAFGSYDDAAQAARWLKDHSRDDAATLAPAYAVIERKGLWFVIDLRTGAVSNGSLTQAEAGLVLWGLKLRNLMHS